MTKEEQEVLGMTPIGIKNDNPNAFKETLLYLIKCDNDIQDAIKKFVL